jgi:PAS domain S-box-containing protein
VEHDDRELFHLIESAIFQRQMALEHIREAITITDPRLKDNPIVYVNPSFLDLTGYTEEEVLFKNCRFLQGKRTDKRVSKRMADALRDCKAVTVDIINYRKDGKPFWNHIEIGPVFNRKGECVNFVAVQRDVTYYKELERKCALQEKIIDTFKCAMRKLEKRARKH